MRKIITCGLLAAAALSATMPAFADNDSKFASGVNAAGIWNFTAAATCIQELAVVPALSDWSDSRQNNCANGNVIDHTAGILPLGR